MKRVLLLIVSLLTLAACEYDDSAIWDEIRDHESRILKLETLCNQMNTNITSLQTIVTVLQKNDYVTGIAPIMEGGNEIGYTITFSVSGSVTIYHGKNGTNGQDGEDGQNGQNGKDGKTPVIGVKQDSDGIYYWTLNGEWLLDENGNRIKAVGTDGKNGENGVDGANGTDGSNGVDGITPKLKIEEGYWYVSYDNGSTWEQLGKATADNSNSSGCLFKRISDDSQYVYLTLNNGTVLTLTKKMTYDTLESLGTPPDDEIWYVTYHGKFFPVPTHEEFVIISNEIVNGKGIIKFKKSITSLSCYGNHCHSLRYLSLPKSIEIIDGSFGEVHSLEGVIIPEGVKTIYGGFDECYALETITLPSTLSLLEVSTFNYCHNLKRVYLKSQTPPTLHNPNSISQYPIFENGRKFYVPMDAVESYKTAEGWSRYANDIIGYDF